jgi:hypothetical protein
MVGLKHARVHYMLEDTLKSFM